MSESNPSESSKQPDPKPDGFSVFDGKREELGTPVPPTADEVSDRRSPKSGYRVVDHPATFEHINPGDRVAYRLRSSDRNPWCVGDVLSTDPDGSIEVRPVFTEKDLNNVESFTDSPAFYTDGPLLFRHVGVTVLRVESHEVERVFARRPFVRSYLLREVTGSFVRVPEGQVLLFRVVGGPGVPRYSGLAVFTGVNGAGEFTATCVDASGHMGQSALDHLFEVRAVVQPSSRNPVVPVEVDEFVGNRLVAFEEPAAWLRRFLSGGPEVTLSHLPNDVVTDVARQRVLVGGVPVIRLVEHVRAVQLMRYGFAHDATHDKGELVQAARVYLLLAGLETANADGYTAALRFWPWGDNKPSRPVSEPDRMVCLLNAAALLVAESERRLLRTARGLPTVERQGSRPTLAETALAARAAVFHRGVEECFDLCGGESLRLQYAGLPSGLSITVKDTAGSVVAVLVTDPKSDARDADVPVVLAHSRTLATNLKTGVTYNWRDCSINLGNFASQLMVSGCLPAKAVVRYRTVVALEDGGYREDLSSDDDPSLYVKAGEVSGLPGWPSEHVVPSSSLAEDKPENGEDARAVVTHRVFVGGGVGDCCGVYKLPYKPALGTFQAEFSFASGSLGDEPERVVNLRCVDGPSDIEPTMVLVADADAAVVGFLDRSTGVFSWNIDCSRLAGGPFGASLVVRYTPVVPCQEVSSDFVLVARCSDPESSFVSSLPLAGRVRVPAPYVLPFDRPASPASSCAADNRTVEEAVEADMRRVLIQSDLIGYRDLHGVGLVHHKRISALFEREVLPYLRKWTNQSVRFLVMSRKGAPRIYTFGSEVPSSRRVVVTVGVQAVVVRNLLVHGEPVRSFRSLRQYPVPDVESSVPAKTSVASVSERDRVSSACLENLRLRAVQVVQAELERLGLPMDLSGVDEHVQQRILYDVMLWLASGNPGKNMDLDVYLVGAFPGVTDRSVQVNQVRDDASFGQSEAVGETHGSSVLSNFVWAVVVVLALFGLSALLFMGLMYNTKP